MQNKKVISNSIGILSEWQINFLNSKFEESFLITFGYV